MELLLLKRRLVKAALPMITACAALVPGACQDRLVYHPDTVMVSTPAAIGLEYQDVMVRTADGVLVNAWWIPSAGQRYAVLFCHGNAGNISHRLDTIRILHGLRLGIFIFDYRGFGKSEGSPSEEGTYRDAAAVWDYMTRALEIRPCDIVVMGRSLGAAVAAWLAEKRAPALLVLESGFFSVEDMVRHHCPLCPAGLLFSYEYATGRHAAGARCPVLVVHSRDDEVVPFKHGRRVYDGLRGERYFLEISGSHNEGFILSGNDYVSGLDAFVSRHYEKRCR